MGWWVRSPAGKEAGPYTFVQLQSLMRQERIGPLHRVRIGLLAPWQPAPDILRPGFGLETSPEPERPVPSRGRTPFLRWHVVIIASAALAVLAVAGALVLQLSDGTPAPADPSELCAAHLKLLARGLLQYADEHAGVLPSHPTWETQVRPYVPIADAYTCPAVPGSSGYEHNANLSDLPLRQVARPAGCAALWDAGALGPSETLPTSAEPHRHKGGDNWAFVDGHVEWQRRGSQDGLGDIVRPY